MEKLVLVREWDPDRFHQRVREMEETGYEARRESYRVVAEMSPETGRITHLYTIEMVRADRERA